MSHTVSQCSEWLQWSALVHLRIRCMQLCVFCLSGQPLWYRALCSYITGHMCLDQVRLLSFVG